MTDHLMCSYFSPKRTALTSSVSFSHAYPHCTSHGTVMSWCLLSTFKKSHFSVFHCFNYFWCVSIISNVSSYWPIHDNVFFYTGEEQFQQSSTKSHLCCIDLFSIALVTVHALFPPKLFFSCLGSIWTFSLSWCRHGGRFQPVMRRRACFFLVWCRLEVHATPCCSNWPKSQS